MDTQANQRLKELIARSQKMAVAVSRNHTMDEMGAALALYLSLQNMGKSVSIVSPTEPLVEVSNLVGIDKVKTRHEGGDGADLVVSFPYNEGEIEKVSYTIENGFLNIVVKAGEQGLTFQERDVKYTRGGGGGGAIDALLTVGVAQLNDVQSVFSMDALKNVSVVNIDTRQNNQGYGDIVLVAPQHSSVSEFMTQLLGHIGAVPDVDIAQNLMDGISFATENFQSPRTSFLAFEMAGVLMRQGAVRGRVQAGQQRPQRQDFGQQQRHQQPRHDRGDRDNRRQQFGDRQHRDDRRQQQYEDRPQRDDRRQQYGQPRDDRRQQQPQQRMSQPPMPQPQPEPQPQRMTPPAPQAMPQPAPTQQMPPQPTAAPQQDQQFDDDFGNPPSDWLTPKVYKGSSNV